MAGRIRALDWGSTPLGPSAGWPDRLKLMVEQVLASPLVASLVCGPQRIAIYNDAAARLYGDRHPGALGRALPQVFPEGWATVGPLYDRVFAGEVVAVSELPLDLVGEGPASAFFDAVLIPVRDGTGDVASAHMTGREVGARVRVEASLRESEERFRAFVTASTDVVYRMSADWTEMRVLDGRGFLADTSDPSSNWMNSYIDPADRPVIRAAIDAAMRDKSIFELEHRVRRADGSLGWTQSRAVPILDEDGSIREWLGAATDVTGQVEAARAFRESEAIRRVALDGGRMGTWRWSLKDRLIRGDPRFQALWGFPPSEEPRALSQFTDRLSPAGAAEMEEIVTEAIEAAKEFDGTLEIVSGSAAGRWIRWRGRAAADDTSVLHGVAFDITEQKRAEAALRASEERYRQLFDSIDQGVTTVELIYGEDGRCVDCLYGESNPSLERMTGLRDIEGRLVSEVFPNLDPEWLERCARIARTGEPERFEGYVEGVRRWLEVYASRVGGAGSRRSVQVYTDITERRHADTTLRESDGRKAFLLKLSDTLRAETGLEAVGHRAVGMIAEKLGVDRVYLVTLTPGDDTVVVTHETRREDLPPLSGSYRGSDFPSAIKEIFERTIVYEDVRTDARLTDLDRVSFAGLSAVGFIAASIRRGTEVMIWAAGAVSTRPRSWTATEISLFEDAVERTWAAVERARAEEELRESEQRFRTLSDTAPAFIWFNDEVGANVSVNQAFLDYTGRSAERIAGEGWHGLVHPDHEQRYVESYLEAVRTTGSWSGRSLLRRADGAWHWFDNYARPLFRDDGSYRGHVGVSIDVDDKVRAAEALGESEAKYRTLFENMTEGYAIGELLRDAAGRAIDWRFIEFNPALERHTGMDRAASTGRWFGELFPGADRSYWLDVYQSVVDTRSVRAFEDYWPPIDRWLGGVASPADEGRFYITFRDVSDRKRSELALRESEERYHALFAVSPVPFMVLAPNPPHFTITAANDAYLVATMTTREGLIGRRLFDVFTDDPGRPGQRGSDALATSLNRVLSTRRTDAMERVRYDIVTPDGRFEPHWWLAINAPLLDAHGAITAIIHQVDRQTELHLAEEAEQQFLARQKVLVAELQHRTRNLMGVVRAMTDSSLERSGSLADFRDRFGDRLAALARVQGLLSRLNEWDRVTFDELIHAEMDAIDGAAGKVRLEGPDGIALRSSTVQTLALALHELATNAVKYGALSQPEAQLTISWSVERRERDARPWLRVDWCEKGVRMPPPQAGSHGGGSGRELIEKALPYQLGAETTFSLGEDGVRCTIALPVSEHRVGRSGADG